jgi:cytochrome c553
MKRVAVLLLVFGMNLAHAEAGRLSAPNNTKWKDECGSCHIPYPPQMLTADNWRSLMGGLDKHFGANATLDAKDNKMILDFLEHNAGSGDRYRAASLRISDTPWFKHEHHVINAKEWVNPEVKSRSNCSACHGKVVLGN